MSESTIIFKEPDEREFEQVKQLAVKLQLDTEELNPSQFLVICDNKKVIAFGRLREHKDATELCTIGVDGSFRGKGYGIKIVKHLLSKAEREVYLVTVIPGFFAKLDFDFAEKYPESLQKKADLCSTHYHVGEIYRVMKWEKK